jgi:hypothetical protein
MKLEHQFILFFLPACLLVGCHTGKETIRFSDEHTHPSVGFIQAAFPSSKKLDDQESLEIELAVYGYLLQRHFWDDNAYSAVFLQSEDAEVNALIKKFPNHIPPIRTSDRAELKPNRAPVDRDTGRPAMLLSVDALDPADNSVEAVGKWYAGDAVAGFYTFSLRKIGGDWVIAAVK